MLVKQMVGVVLAISLVTTLALWWGRPSRHPLPRYQPDPRSEKAIPLPELGAMLYERKGCNVCHTVDGTSRVGPSFLHDVGSRITLSNGSTIIVDEAYILESIESPQAKARPGFPPAMPSEYATLLTRREKAALVAYITSLR